MVRPLADRRVADRRGRPTGPRSASSTCSQRRRARQQQQQVGVLGPRDEDLLTVDDIAVAVAHGRRLQLRRVRAGRRLGDAEGLQAQLAARDLRQVACCFCASEPCRSSVPMMYICAWQAPGVAARLRLISSRMIDASAMPRPAPPYSSGMSAARYPASVSALTNASGYSRPGVEVAPVGVGKPRRARGRPAADRRESPWWESACVSCASAPKSAEHLAVSARVDDGLDQRRPVAGHRLGQVAPEAHFVACAERP